MLFWKTAHQTVTRLYHSTQRTQPRTMSRRLIVFDFDGTVTQHDTINVLAQFAISSRGPPGSPSHNEASQKWKQIVDLYVADHSAHKESYFPPAKDRQTLAQELSYLESLRTVEMASAERVVEQKFFAGLRREEWVGFGRVARFNGSLEKEEDEGKTVKMRKGFSEFVARCKEKEDTKLGVLSVNWSKAFVEGVLEVEDPRRDEEIFEKRVNELRYPGGELEGPEEMGGRVMMTVRDKLEGFETMLLQQGEKVDGQRSVYFGDSVTDLECLLRADTGIVVVNEGEEETSKLLDTLRRVGFEVPHVSEAREGMKLAWARDFEEVLGSKILG
ncbi:HAD-like domain-containing protein [Sordaria brevicollis]|uniref:HAD-like domain-containing protein n=1 Tax=Sordaria brevicollis TaxID=83679 RepID=A0AAE0P9A2_SORBR|nr:HAD-like domain-containing protein [Sordaria brevicollis]